jgi:hypothetical protein
LKWKGNILGGILLNVNKLFRKITAKTELKKQREVWKVFGVNYEAEKRKQEEIWRSLPKSSPVMKDHGVVHKILVNISKKRDYEQLKTAIYNHLCHRKDFERTIDVTLIEQAARLFADWLYIEEIMTKEPKEDVRKYADALVKVHSMLLNVLDELHVTPKMRRALVEDLKGDSDVDQKLKQIIM